MMKNTKTVRRLKLTDYELRVAINALNAYRIKQKNCGVDNSATSNLINELTPELLEFVDEGKIGMRPAVEISYLQEEEQRDLVDYIDTEGTLPSHAQTIRMRELSREGKLDTDTINEIMSEEKGNQKGRLRISLDAVCNYIQVQISLLQQKKILKQRTVKNFAQELQQAIMMLS